MDLGRFDHNSNLGAVIDRAIFGNRHLSGWGGPGKNVGCGWTSLAHHLHPNLLLIVLARFRVVYAVPRCPWPLQSARIAQPGKLDARLDLYCFECEARRRKCLTFVRFARGTAGHEPLMASLSEENLLEAVSLLPAAFLSALLNTQTAHPRPGAL